MICDSASERDRNCAVNILSYWRNLHTAPMQVFWDLLKRRLDKDFPDALLARRLKRYSSIVAKLKRGAITGLERMQDIGGLRVIMGDIADVRRLHEAITSQFHHTAIIPPKDYIANPKPDGYRSLHQVFAYKSRNHPELDNLRVEIQLRTRLQHAWATAVETLGIIDNSSFKSGEGSEEAKRYFRLASALFSFDEQSPALDEYAGISPKIMAEEIRDLDKTLQFATKIQAIAHSLKFLYGSKRRRDYHLLELNTAAKTVNLTPFSKNQLEFAEGLYKAREQDTRDNPEISLVLIGAGKISAIQAAYPNYFLDAHLFLENLERICAKLR